MKKITVSGVGCCLVDRLYNQISFQSEAFSGYLSGKKGDGGLTPGRLVFKEEFDRFTGKEFLSVLPELTGGRPPEKLNVGGPCIVALIHAAQMTEGDNVFFRFYGCGGQDEDGRFLLSALQKTPVDVGHYGLRDAMTPSTIVLSDPDYDHGNGERVFINSIGAAWNYAPQELDDAFFASEVVVFGGTALVPAIHDHLDVLLEKAKSNGCFTIVNTVFDFRNEKAYPDRKWPLGQTDDAYRYIDLLITDRDEALHLSGKTNQDEAMAFFREHGVGAVVITNGAKNICLYSTGKRFNEIAFATMPVSEAVTRELKKGHDGDTTGCGDNFAGGMIASVVLQLQQGKERLDLTEACRWGVVSGGFTCFYIGGTWFEQHPGEKRERIVPYYEHYKKQTGDGA
ncbi:MAG: carbohydrate kinase family protein [Tannerella sp.]|jgi:sugar/nucleoside kinase (ribokinase family)|nr:carbohydrate kinase family protein [Tannerella sp.]